MKDDSLNHQGAVSLAKSDPLTVGSFDHFDSVAQKRLPLGAELQLALNLIPAHTWYAAPSGALTFLNERGSDYLGLPQDHPLRFGIDTGAEWDSHIPLLHPDDHEETRRVWSDCLRTGGAGAGDALPTLTGLATNAGTLTFAPASITFLAIPAANKASCR